jgi:predicted MFS family arabinose efflux permease
MAENANSTQAPSREFVSVLILALGFGLVGVDRFMISALFPVIAQDLKLGYGDIGTITGALAIAWGLAALFMGNLSDRIGRRLVLVSSLVLFSALIGASGLAGGLASLVLVRIVMGFADGAYTPASISATMAASPPQRRGQNIGLQQMTAFLFGLGFAPLIVTALLHVIDWRWIFSLFVVPGFIVAWLTWKIIPRDNGEQLHHGERNSWADWRTVLGYGNIRILMALMLSWLTCLVTTSAFLPNYLLDHLHLEFAQMGTVMSAIGFGGTVGTILLPWLSDKIGRKPVMLLGILGAGFSLIMLSMAGPHVGELFACLFFAMFCIMALLTLTVGPLCAETVPPALMATASGVVIAAGELFGGGLAPIIVGYAAQHFGIEHILWLPIGMLGVAFILGLLLRETRPRVTVIV